MRIFRTILGSILYSLASCQPNSIPITALEEKGESTSIQREQPQQTEVLSKDTLKALQNEVARKPTEQNQADFREFFRKLAQSIQEKNADAFNTYIDPQLGLYIIDTPGAVPHFTHITDITTFRRSNARQQPFFSIREEFQDCKLEEVEFLPTLTCEGENNNFTRQGCFLAEASLFRKSNAHQYANLPAEAERRIVQNQQLVSKTVLHTKSGFRFHFGQVNGQWRVLFVDLSVPCSA